MVLPASILDLVRIPCKLIHNFGILVAEKRSSGENEFPRSLPVAPSTDSLQTRNAIKISCKSYGEFKKGAFQDELAPTIGRFETGNEIPAYRSSKALKVMAALEAADIGFIDENSGGSGVRLCINGQIHRHSFWLINSFQHCPGMRGLFKKARFLAFYFYFLVRRRDLNARAP